MWAHAQDLALNAAAEPTGRRDIIDRAWTRSRMCGLDPGSPLDLPYTASFDHDGPFTRAARPVLDYLGGLLPGCGTAAVLLDAEGRLLARVCDDPSLARRLNDGSSRPGFVWSEEYAGANAVGIALEERVPTWTAGQDHYLEALRDLACAAVPIVNPLSQRIVGVLDLTARLSRASPLMLPMALQAASTIEQRLVDAGSVREQALLGRFLAASRRSGKAVLALSDRAELSNHAAARLLDPSDRALLAHASSEHPDGVREITLSDGSRVVARFEHVEAQGRIIGSLVTIGAAQARPSRQGRPSTPTRAGTVSSASEYVGRSASSSALRADAQTMADATFPLLITGEAGVGKLRLAKVIACSQDRVVMLDARSYSREGETSLLREVSALSHQSSMCVILRHVSAVPEDVLQELGSVARASEKYGSRIIATATSTGSPGGADVRVPIGVRLYIPALRERPEDILDLAPHLLARRGSTARLAPSALQTLLRCEWPGNVGELDMVLAGMMHRARGPELTLAELPVHYQRGARRLRRIEQVERTAIVQALAEADGNKTRAACILEIGRATLYRKMRVYGLAGDDLAI